MPKSQITLKKKLRPVELEDISVFILGIESRFRGQLVVDFLKTNQMDPTIVWGMEPYIFSEELISRMANQKQANFLIGRNLTLGEISCSLGHLEMYERFLLTGRPLGLFLEDDVIVDESLIEFLRNFYDNGSAQLINLAGYLNKNLMPTPFPISLTRKDFGARSQGEVLRCLRYPFCAYGYLMNREAAQIAVTAMRGKKINSQADFPFSWRTLVEFYITLLPIVKHAENQSLLDNDRAQVEPANVTRDKLSHRLLTLRRLNPYRVFQGKRLGLSGRALFKETYSNYFLSKYFPKSILTNHPAEKFDSHT